MTKISYQNEISKQVLKNLDRVEKHILANMKDCGWYTYDSEEYSSMDEFLKNEKDIKNPRVFLKIIKDIRFAFEYASDLLFSKDWIRHRTCIKELEKLGFVSLYKNGVVDDEYLTEAHRVAIKVGDKLHKKYLKGMKLFTKYFHRIDVVAWYM